MLKLLSVLFASAAMTMGVAQAADPMVVSLESRPEGIPVADGPFSWSGFYAGIYGVAAGDRNADVDLGLGIDLGVNAQFDVVLVGAEVALQATTSEPLETAYGQVLGRAGLLLTDEVVIYAAAGYGFELDGPASDVLAGGGVEMAVSDSLSLRAEYLRGFASDGLENRDQFTFGANLHF
jgi:outer membrane immunogenic protein